MKTYYIIGIFLMLLVASSVNADTCGTLNANKNLTSDINSNGTCFTINADNIILDGMGFSIVGNYSGRGVVSFDFDNITVRNLNVYNFSDGIRLEDGSWHTIYNNTVVTTGFSTQARGIEFIDNVNDSNVTENTVTTNTSSSQGIFANDGFRNIFERNIITTYGSGSHGLDLDTQVDAVVINNIINCTGSNSNCIYTHLTSTNGLIYMNNVTAWDIATDGIHVSGSSTNFNVSTNNVWLYGDSDGISVSSNDNIVENNWIFVDYEPASAFAIQGKDSTNITIINNFVNTTSTSDDALYIDNCDNCFIIGNDVYTNGSGAEGIKIIGGSKNVTVFGNYVRVDGSGSDALRIDGAGTDNNLLENNFFVSTGSSAMAVSLQSGNNNVLLNNNLSASGSGDEIEDVSGLTTRNFLIYNNSFGEIRWLDGVFLNNSDLDVNNDLGIGLGRNLFIGNNVVSLNTSAFTSGINSSANITITGLSFLSITNIIRDNEYRVTSGSVVGADCLGVSCTQLIYSSGNLIFNTTGFSSFTANGTINEPPVMQTARIEPVSPFETADLLGYCNATDVNGDNVSYFFRWWMNDTLNVSGLTNSFIEGLEININNVSSSITNANEEWIISCLANNTEGNSSWLNSTPVITLAFVGINITNQAMNDSLVYYQDDVFFNATASDNTEISSCRLWHNNSGSSINEGTATTISVVASEPNLWHYYNFEAGSDGTVFDREGSDDGAISGSPSFNSSTVPNFAVSGSGGSYSMTFHNLTEEMINLTQSYIYEQVSFTISAWVKPLTTVGIGCVWCDYGGTTTKYVSIGTGGSGTGDDFTFFRVGTTRLESTNPDLLDDGNWHHIGGVWFNGNNTRRLYIDGKLNNSDVIPFTSTWLAIPYIGRFNPSGGATSFYWGEMDEIKIYNTSLTSSKIKSIYDYGNTENSTGVVDVYEFTETDTWTLGARVEWFFECNDTDGNRLNGTAQFFKVATRKPNITLIDVNNTVNISALVDNVSFEYYDGNWTFRSTVSDADNDLDTILYRFYNSSGNIIYNTSSNVPIDISVSGSLFIEFAEGNPYNFTIIANDSLNNITQESVLFIVNDTIFPICSGLDNATVIINTSYTWDVECLDEAFFLFNISCSNGFNFSASGLDVTIYNYTGSMFVTGTTNCEWEYCDGHTKKKIKEMNIKTSADNRTKVFNNKVSINSSYLLDEFSTEYKGDRYKFKIKTKVPRDYLEFVVESDDYIHIMPSTKYMGWLVTGTNWIDFQHDDILLMKLQRESDNKITVKITFQNKHKTFVFDSIGELNCVSGTQVISTRPHFLGIFRDRVCPLEKSLSFVFGFFMLIAFLIAVIMLNELFFKLPAFNMFTGLAFIFLAVPIYSCSFMISIPFFIFGIFMLWIEIARGFGRP